MKRLPDTELEVMKALWASERAPVPRSSLEEALRDRGWATNTFNTYLSRLAEKGFVSCEKRGKTNYYTPQVRQADYLAFESGTVQQGLWQLPKELRGLAGPGRRAARRGAG